MVGAIGNQAGVAQAGKERTEGKGPRSIGSLAKAAVASAREAGADLPKNAQGLAASALARGIDPASLFAARVSDSASGLSGDGSTNTEVLVTQSPDLPAGEGSVDGDAEGNIAGEAAPAGVVEPGDGADQSGVAESDPSQTAESPETGIDALIEPVAQVSVAGPDPELDRVS